MMANRGKVEKKEPFIGRRTLEVIKVNARRDSAGFERVSDYFPDLASSEERTPKKSTTKRQYIGRRTGKVISVNARKDTHGFERLSDYFPNEDSDTDDDDVALIDDHISGSKSGIKSNGTTTKPHGDDDPGSHGTDGASSPDSAFGSTKGGGETMSSGNDQDANTGEPTVGHTTTPYSGMVDGTVVDAESSPEQENGLEITKKRLTFSMNATPVVEKADKTSNELPTAKGAKNASVSTVARSRIPVPEKTTVTGRKRKATQSLHGNDSVSVSKKKQDIEQEDVMAKESTTTKVVSKRGVSKGAFFIDNDTTVGNNKATKNKARQVVAMAETQDASDGEDTVPRKKSTRKSTPGNALSRKNSKVSASKNRRHVLESDNESEGGQTEIVRASEEEASDAHQTTATSTVDVSGKKTRGRKPGHNSSRSQVTESEAEGILAATNTSQSPGSAKERLSSIHKNRPKGRMFSSSEDDDMSRSQVNDIVGKTKSTVTSNKAGSKQPKDTNKIRKNIKVTQAVADGTTSDDDTNIGRKNTAVEKVVSKKGPTAKNSKPGRISENRQTASVSKSCGSNVGVIEDGQEVTEDCLAAEGAKQLSDGDDVIDENDEEGDDQSQENNQPRKPPVAKKGKRVKNVGEVENVRRSSRHRVPPLDYWKNERIEYDRRRSGAVVKQVIRVPSPDVKKRKRTVPTRSKKNKGTKSKISEDVSSEDDSEDLDGSFLNHIPEVEDAVVKVLNPETMKEVDMKILHTNKMLNLQSSSGGDGSHPSTLLVDKFFSYGHFGAGEILLRPGAEKGVQHVRKDTMLFRVLSGRVLCTVHQQSFLLGKASNFFVPDGNVYNIKNVSKNKDARLSFTQIKG